MDVITKIIFANPIIINGKITVIVVIADSKLATTPTTKEYIITIIHAARYSEVNAFLRTMPSLNASLNFPLSTKNIIAIGII